MFVGVQVTTWSKQLEAQHPGCIFWSSLLTHILHPFKWGHNLFFLRSLLHAQWLACWQLIPEKTTAHEQFIWLCFQHWHLFHHPCDGYTLRFQILRVMTSSAPRDRRWFVCHDPWVRPQVSVDGNHDMKWVEGSNMFKHPQLHIEKIKFNSSPSPAALGTKKSNCWTSPGFTIRRTAWSKLHTDPRATNIQNTVISLRCLHRSSYSGQRLLERYQSWKQHQQHLLTVMLGP